MVKIKKTWGWEHCFANTDKYCGKLIYVRADKYSSEGRYHYHINKDETFHVIGGELRLEYYKNNKHNKLILHRGDSFRILPGVKHRFSAVSEGCAFIEASTTYRDSDSYRCELIDGQWEVI